MCREYNCRLVLTVQCAFMQSFTFQKRKKYTAKIEHNDYKVRKIRAQFHSALHNGKQILRAYSSRKLCLSCSVFHRLAEKNGRPYCVFTVAPEG